MQAPFKPLDQEDQGRKAHLLEESARAVCPPPQAMLVKRSQLIGYVTMDEILAYTTDRVGHDTAYQTLCSLAVLRSAGKSVWRQNPGNEKARG